MTTTGVSDTTATNNPTSTQTTVAATDPLADKDTFLQLLVAQLKYQDPENPADGTQFVTQLAQFSQLEQSTAMRDDLDAMRGVIAPTTTSTSATS